MSGNDIQLDEEFLRQLAVALLEAIPNGEPMKNIMSLATFNTNLLAGILFGGSPSKKAALDGLDAYINDVRSLIQNNFEAAKAAMEENQTKN